MKANENVVDVKPEEVVAEGVNVSDISNDAMVDTPKFDAKKGLLVGGLILTGLIVGYGVYKGAKIVKAKIAAKKAAKAEPESEKQEAEA